MGRAPCCDKANVKRGPWSPEEDTALRNYLERHGTGGNWIALPQKAGLKRCGKSCRLRWLNYLRPDIKHGGFTQEEDDIICSLYVNIGSRWSLIAAKLPGRTDNDVKNYWNTKLKKKFLAGKIGSNSTSTTTTTTTTSSAYSSLQPIKSETTDNYGFTNSLNHNSSSTLHLPMNITDPIHNVSSPYYHQEVTGLQPAPLIQSSVHPFGNSNENSYNLWFGNEDDGFLMEHGFNSAVAYSYDFLHDFGFHDQEKTTGEVGSTVAAADLVSNSPVSSTTMLYANFLANTTCDTKLQGFYQSVTN